MNSTIQIIRVGFEHYVVIDSDRYLIFILAIINENLNLKIGSIYQIINNEQVNQSLISKIESNFQIPQNLELFIEEIGDLIIYYSLINETFISDGDCLSMSYSIYNYLNTYQN